LKSTLDLTVSITGSAQSLSRITTSGPDEFVCSVSPDGRSLLVEVVERGGTGTAKHGLQRIDVNAASRVILSSGTSNNLDATWIRDGSSFVFVSDRLGPYTLVQSLGIAGESGVRFITQPSLGAALTPAASPSGREIVFSISTAERSPQLAIVNLDGSNLRVLGEGRNPSWSPDGKRLLFAREVGGLSRLYTLDASTGTDLTELSNGESNDYGPVWSPDGRYISFTSDRVKGGMHLFIMNPDGRSPTQLTDGRFDVKSPRWAPDGFIYFSANAGGNWDIWRLSVPRK
jgi:TolB protein